MPSVTFDPGVLAPPSSSASAEEVRRYLSTLEDWREFLKDKSIGVYMSDRASDILCEAKTIPMYDTVRDLIRSSGLEEYAVDEIVGLAHHLLRDTPKFEDHFGVRDVVAENVSVVPDLLAVHSLPSLTDELRRCLLLVAMLRQCKSQPVLDHAIVVARLAEPGPFAVQATIQLVECGRAGTSGQSGSSDCCEGPLEGSVPACRSTREFVLALDETAMWRAAQSDLDLCTALRVALFRARAHDREDTEWSELPTFLVGGEFFSTARLCCSVQGRGFIQRLLRAMLETVEHVNVADTHNLRQNPGGGSSDRTTGRCKALRRDIDRQYHLHYWEGDNHLVEFASVVPHNNFSIPDPSYLRCS